MPPTISMALLSDIASLTTHFFRAIIDVKDVDLKVHHSSFDDD